MTKHKLALLILVVFVAAVVSSSASVEAVDIPAVGDVLINEFVANSAGGEWVELFNTSDLELDLSGYYIDDIVGGGGAPKLIPTDSIIPAHGYFVIKFQNFLNNSGDDVRFLNPSQQELDSKTYKDATAEWSWYRYPDGGPWSGLETSRTTPGGANPGTGDIPWQTGTFEIRVFDVDQGDSQLVIFPSGYSILIDVAEKSWNSGKGASLVAAKIRAITGGSHVNAGVVGHLHLDHSGYAGYGGFWALIEKEGITFDKIVDRNAGVWVDGLNGGDVDGQCDPDLEIQWLNAGTVSGTAQNWICYATNPANSNIYDIRELAQLGSTTQIDPPDANALVTIVQTDAAGVMMVDGVTPVAGDWTGLAVPPSENDYSIALKITYGTIDYATASDTDGEYATSGFNYTYNDVETVIAPLFGQVEILRVNHHGSGHSSNQTYVDTLNPEVSFVSCGANSYGHPDQVVLDRLAATGEVYLTNLCDESRDYSKSTILHGDIILRSVDGVTYSVLLPREVFIPVILTQ